MSILYGLEANVHIRNWAAPFGMSPAGDQREGEDPVVL